jgi:hypothetical protein
MQSASFLLTAFVSSLLAIVVFAAVPLSLRSASMLVVGGVIGFGLSLLVPFNTALATVLTVSAVAAHFLFERRRELVKLVVAGILIQGTGALWATQGIAWPISTLLAAGIALAVGLLVRQRRGFVTNALIDEASIIVLLVTLLVAALPIVGAGWNSASALNARVAPMADFDVPGVALALLCLGALAAGAVYFNWRRRSC